MVPFCQVLEYFVEVVPRIGPAVGWGVVMPFHPVFGQGGSMEQGGVFVFGSDRLFGMDFEGLGVVPFEKIEWLGLLDGQAVIVYWDHDKTQRPRGISLPPSALSHS